jgi:hypothetical protein
MLDPLPLFRSLGHRDTASFAQQPERNLGRYPVTYHKTSRHNAGPSYSLPAMHHQITSACEFVFQSVKAHYKCGSGDWHLSIRNRNGAKLQPMLSRYSSLTSEP